MENLAGKLPLIDPQPGVPRVSVVIPCFNGARLLPEAIESVLAQTYPNVEILVVDDGSEDDTSGVAARYACVRCLRQENRGVAEACNAGYRASVGDYLMFLGADDRLTAHAVDAHLRCFAENPEAAFVVGDIDLMAHDGSHAGSPRWPILEANQYEELLKVNHVANTIAVMFRRSVFETVGEFDPTRRAGEDYEMILRAARSLPSAHHRNVVTHYRRHTSSMTCNGTLMLRSMLGVMRSQRPFVKGNPRLVAALRKGENRWRARFVMVAAAQMRTHFRRRELLRAVRIFGVVSWSLTVLLWRDPARLLNFVGRRLGFLEKRLDA